MEAQRRSSSHIITIHGVDIEFPFKPYTEQVKYMECVIKSLQSGKNALLESPTGTGKTLCLLCATLAWRRSEIKKRGERVNVPIPDGKEPDYPLGWGGSEIVPGAGEDEPNLPSAPRIIYASRTHSQLAQVVSELKKTAYAKDARISVLGSREQMCIHPEVSKQPNNTAMIHSCRNKVSKHLCHFYNNVENLTKAGSFTNEVLDIEELVSLGKKRNACPYYAAREQSKEADCGIIFTPYNYLLDRKARRSNNLEVSGNIIIFDEAHNLERMCEESASFDLTSLDIAKCIHETGELLRAAVKMSETGVVPDGYEAGEMSALGEFDLRELATLKALFVHLERHLQDIKLPEPYKALTRKGRYMFEFLAPLSISFGTHEAIIDLVDKVVAYLSTLSNSFQIRGTALQKFSEVLKVIFSAAGGENPTLPSSLLGSNVATEMMMDELSKFYRVHIREDEARPTKTSWGTSNSIATASTKSTVRTLSYWCFSPGYAMRDLVACGVKNLILTSGTLSPIESFTCELQVNFPITLQNTHVIDDHQVFVATIKKSLNYRRLESTYKTRNDYSLAQDIGNLLVRFAEICPGGLLVFFPSYASMDGYIKMWNEMSSDIMRKIDLRKPCTVESRSKNSLKDSMEKYYSDVTKPQGASFFAICRGKVSEGLDFANENGRAVVIIGLPFPPSKDAKVKEKMGFLESLRATGAKNTMDGQKWYRLQALRAVNQAIGRVIRHRHDYGAILLLDYRYANKDNFCELPKWIKPRVIEFDDAEKAIRRFKSFFCSIREKEKVRLCNGTSNPNKESSGSVHTSDQKSQKDGIFFGGQPKKPEISSQYFTKSSNAIANPNNKTLSIPKTNDLSNHMPSSVGAKTLVMPPTTSNGSCTECPGGSSKRRRTSEDEDSQNLVPIKNFKKKLKGFSLLDALDQNPVEQPKENEEGGAICKPSSKLARALLIRDKMLDDQRRGVPKRKIKVVENKTKEESQSPVEKDNATTSSAVPSLINSSSSNEGVANRNGGLTATQKATILNTNSTDLTLDKTTAREKPVNWDETEFIKGTNATYLKAVKEVLKGEEYAKFKKMLLVFASNKDPSVLAGLLSEILLKDEKCKMLFRGFVKFYKNGPHIKEFVKKCQEITGKKPAGY